MFMGPKVTFVCAMISYRIKSETVVQDYPFGVVGLRRGKNLQLPGCSKSCRQVKLMSSGLPLCRENLQCSYFPAVPVSYSSKIISQPAMKYIVHLPSVSEFPSQTTSLVMGLIYASRSFGGERGRVTTGYRKGGERGNDHCFCSRLFLCVDFCDCTEL